MVVTLGPLLESAFALYAFVNGGSTPISGWRPRVRRELGRHVFEFELLSRRYAALPELLEALLPSRESSRAYQEHDRITGMLTDFCKVAVLPYWSQIVGHLESVRDVQGQIVISNGLERLLGMLHPRLTWQPPVLELQQWPDHEIELRGDGLLLAPSFFLQDQSCVFMPGTREQSLPAIAFPVNRATKAQLWESREPNEQALAALMGQTRAAALQELAEGRTTGELAERLGISMAGASKHAAVLRKSGLITTARNRNTALHTLTSLGLALLRSRGLTLASNGPKAYPGERTA